LTLSWATIYLYQGNLQHARDLLNLLSPNAISAEQRLLRICVLGRICLAEDHAAEAQKMLEAVFEREEFLIHIQILGHVRFALACAYEAQEKFLLAYEAFNACVEAIEQGVVSEPLFAVEVYSAFAEHHRRLERRDLAVQFYQRALNKFEFVFSPSALAES